MLPDALPPMRYAALAVLGVAVLLISFLGAILLRVAVALYNRLFAGPEPDRRVPAPSFARALGIVYATAFVQVTVALVIALARSEAAAALPLDLHARDALAHLGALPVSGLVLVLMLRALLPTRLSRAVGVAFCQGLIMAPLVAAVVFAVVTWMLVSDHEHWRAGRALAIAEGALGDAGQALDLHKHPAYGPLEPAALVGTWQCHFRHNGEDIHGTETFAADHTYKLFATARRDGTQDVKIFTATGTWSLQGRVLRTHLATSDYPSLVGRRVTSDVLRLSGDELVTLSRADRGHPEYSRRVQP